MIYINFKPCRIGEELRFLDNYTLYFLQGFLNQIDQQSHVLQRVCGKLRIEKKIRFGNEEASGDLCHFQLINRGRNSVQW